MASRPDTDPENGGDALLSPPRDDHGGRRLTVSKPNPPIVVRVVESRGWTPHATTASTGRPPCSPAPPEIRAAIADPRAAVGATVHGGSREPTDISDDHHALDVDATDEADVGTAIDHPRFEAVRLAILGANAGIGWPTHSTGAPGGIERGLATNRRDRSSARNTPSRSEAVGRSRRQYGTLGTYRADAPNANRSPASEPDAPIGDRVNGRSRPAVPPASNRTAGPRRGVPAGSGPALTTPSGSGSPREPTHNPPRTRDRACPPHERTSVDRWPRPPRPAARD